jgi:hypothetical protein
MEVLLLAVMAASNIFCFLIGAKVGQKVVKGEEVELPTIDPMKAYREHQEKREAQREQDKVEAIMRNIEAYNGTPEGQKDIPGG